MRNGDRRSTIAFVTHGGSPDIAADDRHAVAAITGRTGLRVEGRPWDAPEDRWAEYAAVVIRSTWNYHHRPQAFLDWAEGIERAGANLWNPAAVVRWNADKRYLGELARAGVPVVPTAWLLRGEEADLAAVLEARGWDRVVVKPSVSATAYRTWVTDPARVRSDPSHVDRLREILRDTDAMVQPYVPEVVSEGEWSFIFLADGAGGPALSHAVLKRPAAGDFRVQDEHGGSASLAIPPVRLKERVTGIASSLWCLLPAQPLYARVDGVAVRPETHPGGFLLMELELIEPMLFLGAEPAAGARLADAVAGRLRDHG